MRLMVRIGLVLSSMTLGLAVPAAVQAQSPLTQQDKDFLVAAHQSNLAEIAAGNTAQAKGASATVKDLGARMVSDHTKLDASLTPVAAQLGVALPGTPNTEQQNQLAQVSAKSGQAFDAAWLAAMIAGHRQALAGIQTELSSGSSEQVKQLAQTAQPAVQEHLNLLLAANGGAAGAANSGTGGQAASLPLPALLAGTGLAVLGVLLLVAGLFSLLRHRQAVS
jgi:putative membrane protein